MPTVEVPNTGREKFRSKPRTRPSQWSRTAGNATGRIKVKEVAPADRARVITRLDQMRSMPYAHHKAKVDLAGTVVELDVDPLFGPVVRRADGRIERLEFCGVAKVGSGGGKHGLDHGFGSIAKPWFEMSITEQEAALIIAAKKNHKLKTWYDATDKAVWDDHHGYEIKPPGVETGWIAYRRICGAVFPGVFDKLWVPGSQQSYFDEKMKGLIEKGLVLDPDHAVPLEEAPPTGALPAPPVAAVGAGSSAASGDRAAAAALLWERASILDDPGRKYDIVVYGAAGYVGRLCARQLDALLSEGGQPQRWALAGRDEEQLRAIASSCRNPPGVIKVADLTAISSMCRDTRVLVSLAGPYARSGEDVVSCCVNQCTHYIDAATEAVWMKRMVDRYHLRAREKGVMLVFSAGQESATYDTMAYKLARKLGPLSTLRTYMLRYGGSSGGHLLTGQLMLQHMASESKYAETFHDPYSLGGKRASAHPGGDDKPAVEEDALFPGLWFFPLPDTTQVRVMRRTCALFGAAAADGVDYGRDPLAFPACDAAAKRKVAELSLGAPPPRTQDEAKQLWEAFKGCLGEQVAKGTAPPTGGGPSEGARGLNFSDCYMVAEGENGEWAHVHHTAPDACEVTAICCASGALVLLQEQDAIRPMTRGGCVTPAYAFHGSTWADRCEAAVPAGTSHRRMVYEVLEGKPRAADLAAAVRARARRAVEGETAIAKGTVQAFDAPPAAAARAR